ncbi:hypothetical protein GCM10028819_13210 [Spirosoma humi]
MSNHENHEKSNKFLPVYRCGSGISSRKGTKFYAETQIFTSNLTKKGPWMGLAMI